jgi:hypothetical protein
MSTTVSRREAAFEYFFGRIDNPSLFGCWIWNLSTGSHGYGQLFWDKKVQTAHRFAYLLFNGDPGDLSVLHKCGNRRCCNPLHLYSGTQLQNHQDMRNHGTYSPPPKLRGEQVGNAALSDAQASEIKWKLLERATCKELAAEYKVSTSTVSLIARNKRYTHVESFLPQRTKSSRPKITKAQVVEVKTRLANSETGISIARTMGLTPQQISRVNRGMTVGI